MKRCFVILLMAAALIFSSSACGKKAPPYISGHNHYVVSIEQGTGNLVVDNFLSFN